MAEFMYTRKNYFGVTVDIAFSEIPGQFEIQPAFWTVTSIPEQSGAVGNPSLS